MNCLSRIKNLCRVCLQQTTSIISLTDGETQQRFEDCTSVMARLGDNYPTQLCAKCYQKVMDWFAFRLQALDSDRQLQNLLRDKDKELIAVSKAEPSEPPSIDFLDVGSMEAEEDFTDAESMSTVSEESVFDWDQYLIPPEEKLSTTENQSCICEQCGKEFQCMSSLRNHFTVHTEERPFSCQLCDSTFKRNYNLLTHLRTVHREIIPRQRPPPAASFPSTEKLQAKQSTVEEKKEFHCDQCEKIFTKSRYLEHHKLILHSTTPIYIVCSMCEEKFPDNDATVQHMKEAHPKEVEKEEHRKKRLAEVKERPFKCHQCEKTFTTSSLLKYHMRFHSDERPYACKFCDFRSKTRYGKTIHEERIHRFIKPRERMPRKSLIKK